MDKKTAPVADLRIVRVSKTRRGYGLEDPPAELERGAGPDHYRESYWFVFGLGAAAGCVGEAVVVALILALHWWW